MFTNKEEFKALFEEKMQELIGKSLENSTSYDKYETLATIISEMTNKKMAQTNKQYLKNNQKQVFYFSLEFLLGKLLVLYMDYLGVKEICSDGLVEMGISLDQMESEEPEAGLGNGGLGRLAACFLDSLASLGISGHGCGIRYKYGLFKQKIVEGYQVELPDNWLREENIWEIKKPDKAVEVRLYGKVRMEEKDGRHTYIHEDYEPILAVPFDLPILGYKSNNANTLRLWCAEPMKMDFDFASFNSGDYLKAVEYRRRVEAISEVLYPNDAIFQNRELRLKQEYFMVSAGVQSIIGRFKKANKNLEDLPEKVAIHINDTHPTLAIPELMRILMDEEGMGWDQAWGITIKTISYTNHTTLPEALEKWPVEMMQNLLPRIFIIINEINERYCKELWAKYPGEWERIERMAIIAHGQVKMAHLAIAGSYSVNGVAAVHTEILKSDLLKNFYEHTPHKFNNKTNGIAFRRWLIKANPQLTKMITDAIGEDWKFDPKEMEKLVKLSYHTNPTFQKQFQKAKLERKQVLAKYIKENYNITVDVNSIFDVHVKRIHGYKRQLLNILHVMHLYNMLKDNPKMKFTPRTFIFAGKAAPSYHYAKKVIKLINTVADMINGDKSLKGKMKIVFMENYNVSLAEIILPAADISNQLSTASKEASGTGNMKFMMNGAVTIGTMDGANIEIGESVGEENIITFGLSVGEVLDYYEKGGYCSKDYYSSDERIRRVADQLIDGYFPSVPKDEFIDIYRSLLEFNDEYFIFKDFDAFDRAREKSEELFKDKATWAKMGITNVAMSGKFSSDYTILKYAEEIWKVK